MSNIYVILVFLDSTFSLQLVNAVHALKLHKDFLVVYPVPVPPPVKCFNWVNGKYKESCVHSFLSGLGKELAARGIIAVALREKLDVDRGSCEKLRGALLCSSTWSTIIVVESVDTDISPLVLHALGHMFGLSDCRNRCVMNPEYVEKGYMRFCDKCAKLLNSAAKEN